MPSKYTFRGTADMSQHDAAINRSIGEIIKYEKEVKKTSKALDGITKGGKQAGASFEGLGKTIEGLDANLEGLTGSFSSLFDSIGGGQLSGLIGQLGGLANPYTLAASAAVAFGVASVKAFEAVKSEMNNFQAITDATDEEMQDISKAARQMSNSTGVATKEIIALESSLVGINPDLINNKEALAASAKAAITLGQAGRISAEQASTALSSILAQYGLAGDKSGEVANAIAAGSKVGAIEIEGLATVMQKAGTTMSSAGFDYAASIAMIEAVGDKWIGKEEELGTKLQSTYSRLQALKGAAEQYNPAVVGTTQALENLSNANLKYSELIKLVGQQNAPVLQQMIDAKDKYQELNKAVRDTNAANEMAAKQTDTIGNAWGKLGTTWDNLLISFAETQPMQELIDFCKWLCDLYSDLTAYIGEVIDEWNNLIGSMDGGLNVWDLLKGYIYLTIEAYKILVETFIVGCAAIVKPVIELWNLISRFSKDLWNKFTNIPIGKAFKDACVEAWRWIKKLWEDIVRGWNQLKEALGLKKGAEVHIKENKTTETKHSDIVRSGELPRESKKIGSKKKGKTGTTKKQDTAQVGSLKYLEERLKKLNDELQNTVVSDERLKQIQEEKKVLQQQIDLIKKRNGLEHKTTQKQPKEKAKAEAGSLQDIEEKISNKQAQLKMKVVGSDAYNQTLQELQKLQDQKEGLEIRIKAKTEVDKDSMNYLLGELARLQEEINKTKWKISLEGNTDKLKELQEELSNLESKEYQVKISVNNKALANQKSRLEDLQDNAERTSEAFSAMGSALSSAAELSGDGFLTFASKTAGAVAEIIPQISKLIIANQAQALSSGTASAAAMPFPANLVAIASIISTVLGVFASLPKFASGGIISAASGLGDYNLARVNGGEMILNGSQQKKLFSILDGTGAQSSNAAIGGNVTFRISGKELVGVLSNYKSKTSKAF